MRNETAIALFKEFGYRGHPYVSNSDLTNLFKQTALADQVNDLTRAFRMGNLIDAWITRGESINTIRHTVDGESFTDEEWEIGRQSKRAFYNDDLCRMIASQGMFQKAFFSHAPRFADGSPMRYEQGRKCLYDIWLPYHRWGCDIKSTTAKTLDQFKAQFDYLHYDRSRYWYMDITGSNQDLVIGISKINFQIFKIYIPRGDDIFNSGKAKAEELAYKFYMLK